MGKKSGTVKSRTPKYLAALGRSNSPCFAFAGTVNGGLFPAHLLIPGYKKAH